MESSPPADADFRTRLHRREVVAELAEAALTSDDLERLFDDATAAVTEALECAYCGVFELRADDEVALVAGTGWPADRVGDATVAAGADSPAGETLSVDEPLVVEDYDADDRFSGAAPAPDATSGVSAAVTAGDEAWGLLGAYATDSRSFASRDARFLERVADVLGAAVENERARHRRGAGPPETDLEEVYGRISDAFFALDEDWRFTYLNEHAHDLINPEDRSLVGERIWDAFPAANDRKFRSAYERAMYEQETVSFEEYYPEPLDTWYEVRAYPSASGLSVYFRDVTDRKERERELERAERRFEAIFEDPNILVGLLEPDGTILDVNGTAMEYVDADLADVRGERLWETAWWSGDERARSDIREWAERAADGEYVDFEADLARQDGKSYTVEGVFRPVTDDDEVVSIVVSARDVTERKDRERDLELFRTLLDYSNDSVLVVDAESGRFIDVNETACERRGYTREELLSLTVPDLEHLFPDMEAWKAHVEELKEQGGLTVEGRHHRKDGSSYPVEVNTTYVELDQGYVFAIARDVTERRKRKQELERYETIVEAVNDGVYVVDDEGRFTMVNEAYAEMLGYEKEELVGMEASEVADEAAMERTEEMGTAVTEDRTEETALETDLVTADGDLLPVEATFALLTDDDEWHRVGVVRDISERRARERQLAESERRYRTLVENFPEGAVGLFDENLEYKVAGGQLLDEVGVDAADRVGETIDDVYPPGVLEEVEPYFEAALEGEANSLEVDLYGRHLYAHILPVRNADDEIFAGMIVVQDVTERREYERQLEQSNERLEQFAYAASHDLQEPLRMVSSYLRLVESRYVDELDEEGREFIEFAVDGAERMREMINALLMYSRVDTRGDPFEPVDLEAVLADVRDDLQVKIEESDAEVTAESLPTVRGDADQLRQVFQNLLDNAIEYSGDEPPRVHVSAERSDEEWLISVSDDGIGIDAADQERVFEVFQRLHTQDEHEGTGIGLALCERIVERHGGDIWVESEPGEGATFAFTLPDAGGFDE